MHATLIRTCQQWAIDMQTNGKSTFGQELPCGKNDPKGRRQDLTRAVIGLNFIIMMIKLSAHRHQGGYNLMKTVKH